MRPGCRIAFDRNFFAILFALSGVLASDPVSGLVRRRDGDPLWHAGSDHSRGLSGRLRGGLTVKLVVVLGREAFRCPRHLRALCGAAKRDLVQVFPLALGSNFLIRHEALVERLVHLEFVDLRARLRLRHHIATALAWLRADES